MKQEIYILNMSKLSTMSLIVTGLLVTLDLPQVLKAFKVTKIEGSPIEETRIHDIKTLFSDSLLKCIEECKSLDVSDLPSCSSVQYDGEGKICILSYIHRSSTPIGSNPDLNAATKSVLLVPGSELSSNHHFLLFSISLL